MFTQEIYPIPQLAPSTTPMFPTGPDDEVLASRYGAEVLGTHVLVHLSTLWVALCTSATNLSIREKFQVVGIKCSNFFSHISQLLI